MTAAGVRGPAISACNARIPMDAMHLPLVFPSPRFRLIMFAFRSTARLSPLNDRCAFSCLENVQRTCASNALSRDYVSRLMEMRESVDLNLPRRNCFSHGFSRVLGFFRIGSWSSLGIDHARKFESFPISFFPFFPSILLEKALPPSLLVAPRNSALPYQILSPSNDKEKKRERGIPLFVHRVLFSLSNLVRS